MHPLRILVVDDDDVDRMAVRRALRRAQLDRELVVEEATSAHDALQTLAGAEWDCLLLDLRLPGTTGLELLTKIRSAGHRVAVVMLTGQGDEQSAVEAMKAGAADYMTKAALDPERLARSILGAVRVRDAERAEALAREQLEAAEQRYRFLADSIPQMVWVILTDGAPEYVNRQFTAYTGAALEEIRRDGWLSVIHPDDRAAAQARWDPGATDTPSFEMQVRLRRSSDGVYRWHLSRATLLVGVDGTARWFGTSTDIEEQKRAEADLVRLNQVAERERARAEESNKAKDEFLAVLSHELRTPLNAMLGWISILRAPDTASEVIARGLATIERNVRTQTQLIEDLLDVSRIVADKLVLEQRPVDLRDVVGAAADTVQPLAAARKVTITTSVAADAVVVNGDGARLQQIVWNLLVNGVKFTPEGGSVALTLERRGGDAVIEVRDSGQGIDPAFLPHIFERFRQENSGTQRAQGGLGLGLSIVHHLVERHGGTISAASDGVGCGATLVVTLPAARASVAPAVTTPAPAPVSGQALRNLEILVVDDDEDSREMLVTALVRQGASVRGARSVADAREQLARQLPHLIISDLGMPDEDGYALITELRTRPPERGGTLPAIALTGYAGLDDQRRARAAGFDEHVSKPIELSKLPAIVARLLARRQVNRAPEPRANETY